jgi:hypothetical protein
MFGLLVRYVVAYTVERRELQFAGILRAYSHFIWHHTAYIGQITGDVLQVVYYGNPMLSRWPFEGSDIPQRRLGCHGRYTRPPPARPSSG